MHSKQNILPNCGNSYFFSANPNFFMQRKTRWGIDAHSIDVRLVGEDERVGVSYVKEESDSSILGT
jgi:hypothetical protein